MYLTRSTVVPRSCRKELGPRQSSRGAGEIHNAHDTLTLTTECSTGCGYKAGQHTSIYAVLWSSERLARIFSACWRNDIHNVHQPSPLLFEIVVAHRIPVQTEVPSPIIRNPNTRLFEALYPGHSLVWASARQSRVCVWSETAPICGTRGGLDTTFFPGGTKIIWLPYTPDTPIKLQVRVPVGTRKTTDVLYSRKQKRKCTRTVASYCCMNIIAL